MSGSSASRYIAHRAAIHRERRQDVALAREGDQAEPVARQVLHQAARLAHGSLQPARRHVLGQHRAADVHRDHQVERPALRHHAARPAARARERDRRERAAERQDRRRPPARVRARLPSAADHAEAARTRRRRASHAPARSSPPRIGAAASRSGVSKVMAPAPRRWPSSASSSSRASEPGDHERLEHFVVPGVARHRAPASSPARRSGGRSGSAPRCRGRGSTGRRSWPRSPAAGPRRSSPAAPRSEARRGRARWGCGASPSVPTPIV